MPDAHEVLSYTISAEDRASAVFRGIKQELSGLHAAARQPLQGLDREWKALGSRKPLELIRADQALQIARTESELAKLNKTVQASGVATKLQNAELVALSAHHRAAQAELAKTAAGHTAVTKAATVAAVGIVGASAAVVAGAVKQGMAWTDLAKNIEQQTGLSGRSLDGLMGSIDRASGTVPYKLDEIAQAAVILKTRFGESDGQIAKTAGLMDGFARRAGQEVTPAIQGLSNILHSYRAPLSDVVGLTDELVSVSQLTQQPLGAMESTIERFSPKLQAMGFGLHESIRLMGILGESGVKADQMGRGLAAAYSSAQKALGGAAGPQVALEKQGDAVRKAQERLQMLGTTIPKTRAEEERHTIEVRHANEALGEAEKKYQSLNAVIKQAGGAHASVGGMVRQEIREIEHAKSSQEAYAIAAGAFGKMVGPAFARAFYNNKSAIEATDHALHQHGATSKLVEAEQHEFAGEITELEEAWHKTERTLAKDLIPALKTFLLLVKGGVDDVSKFTKGNASLAEALGGIATLGAGAFLARKPIGAALSGLSHLPGLGGLSRIPGVGSSDGIVGVRGTTLPGSITNPIMVRVEGGAGSGGLPGGPSTAEKAGGEGLLSKLGKGAKLAGGAALAIEGLNIALPGNSTAAGLPTHGSGLGGQFKGWIHDSSEAFTKGFSDLLSGSVGKALDDIFGHNRVDDLRKFGDELKKLHGPLSDLPAGQMKKVHEEAVALGNDKSLSKWRPQLEAIAKATDPVQVALAKAGGSFSRLRFVAEKELGLLSAHIPGTIKPGTDAAAKAFAVLTGAIQAEMAAGVRSTESGTKEIQKILTEQLRSLGINPNSKTQQQSGKFGPGPGSGSNPLQPTGVGESSGFTGAATGARVPGRPGPDNWTLIDPAGRPAAKVGGAELLIANRHTENAASVATRMVYGKTLGEMVAGERTPHSMATGGRVVTASEFGGHNDPSAFGHSTASGKTATDSLWGFAELSNPPSSLNFSALGHLPMGALLDISYAGKTARRVPKVDVGAGGSGLGGNVRAVDLTYAVARALGAPGLENVTIYGAGQGPPGTAGAVAQIRRVLAKGVHGMIGQIAQGTLDKVRNAANARLAAASAKSGGSAAVSPSGVAPTGGGFNPAQLGGFDGLQVADWIIPELQYARGHGWAGHITSGYRAGFDPHAPGGSMHALDIYPGGAVDFGGMVDPAGLANRAAFIHATAGYPGKRLLTPIGFRDDGHMSGTGHALGGRVNFAGAFGQGGSVTASSPTLALFGEHGTETATFTPHAALGTRVSSSGLAETPGNNPDTGAVEYHTQEEWAEIRRQHTARVKRETAQHKAHKAHGHKGAKPTFEDQVRVGGLGAGTIVSTSAGGIDIPRDVGKLSTSVWAKVVAAIEKTIKGTSDERLAVSLAGKLAGEKPHDPKTRQRLQGLTTKSIEDAASSVVRLTKATPQEDALSAGGGAVTSLGKLIKDARRSNNTGLVALLRKDTEWAFKWSASTIMRTASEAPAGQATSIIGSAVGQLNRLLAKAQGEGRRQIELGLLKDVQKTVAGWHQAITGSLGKQQDMAKAQVDLRVARQTLTELTGKGPGAKVQAGSNRDTAFIKQEEANNNKALAEMRKEQAALGGMIHREQTLLGRLNAKLHRELKKHHKAAAHVIQLEINQIQAALGEAQTQMEEVTATIAQTETANLNDAAEAMRAAYEQFKEEIDATTRSFEGEKSAIGTRGALEEGALHRAGLDFSGLEEAKSKQEGVLTPAQIQQAQSDLAAFTARAQEEINVDMRQRAYDQSVLPGLSGEDRANMVKTIEDLTAGINDLESKIYDQTKATGKLTEATNAATKTFGGTVGFDYNGQQYTVGGQSSVSAPDIMTGV